MTSATLLVASQGAAHAQLVYAPGQFDTAFNGTGVLENPGMNQAAATAVVPVGDPNADGIVVAETSGPADSPTSSVIDEYNISGALVQATSLPGFTAQAVSVVPPGEPNAGNIVAAGYGKQTIGNVTVNQAEVASFNPSGGLVYASMFNPAPGGSTATSGLDGVAVDGAGNVVAVGYAGSSPHQMLVAELQPNGTGSPNFPAGGYVLNNISGGDVLPRGVAVAGGGAGAQIYVTGSSDGYIFAASFTGTGSVNGSFGGGMIGANLQGFGNAITLIANSAEPNNGNIVVAGEYINGSDVPTTALIQWTPSGVRDSSFNGSGPGLGSSQWNAVSYDPYGNFIVAVGQAGRPTPEMVVSQFNATNGLLNTAYGSNGTTTRIVGDGSAFLNAVGFEPDGSTIASGAESPSGGNNTVATLIRLDGPFITVIPPSTTQVTQSGTTTVYFTVQLDELLATPGSVYLCATSPGATINGTQCATITIPAGATSVQVPVMLNVTTSVGSAQQVVVSTGFANGLSGNPQTGTATATVQHLPPPSPFKGYWMVASDGGLFTFGSTHYYGSRGGHPGAPPIIGMATRSDGKGYWLADAAGDVYPFGAAGHYGSAGGKPLAKPIVAIAATPDGRGYWLVASDGGIFTYGDAHYYGSTGHIALAKPIVGMTPTPDGKGYWLVASDGGIFTFGDARFFGSTGRIHLAKPIVGMAAYPGAGGYWMVASDGGIFTFGAAGFHGSTGHIALKKPIVGMAVTSDGKGYWLVASDGGIFTFGDAHFYGSTGALTLVSPIVGMAA